MHLSLNAVACAMRTKNSGVQNRRARSARYPEGANVVCFDLERISLGCAPGPGGAAILAALPTMQARCLHHH